MNANVRPRLSSLTSSPTSVMPITHTTPAKKPMTNVQSIASSRLGMIASSDSARPATTIDRPIVRRRDSPGSKRVPVSIPVARPMKIVANNTP